MTKLTTVIIDDEPLAHEIILDYLAELPFINLVGQYYSAVDALEHLNQHKIDLLILDINMPKLSGIELLRVLTNKPIVIITSAHKHFALESFELDVCDYLHKPFRFERFLKAANKAHQHHQLTRQNQQVFHHDEVATNVLNKNDDTLFIKVDKKLIQLNIADIVFFEAYGNYVKVWAQNKMYLTPRTLRSFEADLIHPESTFIRTHKSFIVQKTHIIEIENSTMKMSSQQTVPIGKNYKKITKLLKT